MLKLLYIENEIENIPVLVDSLNNELYNKVILNKLIIKEKDILYNLKNCNYNILLINEKLLNTKKIKKILEKNNIVKNNIQIVILSNKELYNIGLNVYFSKNIKSAINLISNLYSKEISVNYEIEKFLNIFQFNKSNIGYTYIINFLNICIAENYSFIPTLNELYDKIALSYNLKTSRHIGWNIEKSINNMRKITSKQVLSKYFGDILPSPKLFLEVILKMYYKDISA